MNVEINSDSIQQVISTDIAIDAYYDGSSPTAKEHGIIIAERYISFNKFQWRWHGDNWKRVTSVHPAEKSAVFAEYNQRKSAVIKALNAAWADDLFVVPDNGFIYYRKDNGGVYEFALAAWGYKYPDVPQGGKLEAPVVQKAVKPEPKTKTEPKPEPKTPEKPIEKPQPKKTEVTKPEVKPETPKPKPETPKTEPTKPPVTEVVKHKRKFDWRWLLLLLPLLLLIKCNKTIVVHCYESDGKIPVAYQDVTFRYDSLVKVKTTDSLGVAVFDSLKTSVFGYVCLFWKECEFSAVSECYAAAGVKKNFHYTRRVDLVMQPRRENLHVKLIDKQTGDELPEGILIYRYSENGHETVDSLQADAAGEVEIPNVRFCSKIDLTAKCYGYADTTKFQVPCNQLLVADKDNAMRLRPLKRTFTFFVRNKETGQPIVDALAEISLTKKGKTIDKRSVKTNIKGKGIGVCDTAFILLTVNIHVTKEHFKPGDLENGPFTVEEFVKQKDSVRTIWLIPEPYTVEFQNVDSITGKPIAGVKNIVTIYDPNGTVTTDTVMSNSGGYFPINAKDGSKIVINAYKSPLYLPKKHVIKSFGKPEKIRMKPDMAVLTFRTVEDPSWTILPGCSLSIYGSISGSLPYRLVSPGVFVVTFRKDELLSITASKTRYVTNYTSVKNASFNDLNTPNQKRRDIPLKQDPPPPYQVQNCSGGQVLHPIGNTGISVVTYDMGMQSGIVTIDLYFDAAPDEITVYDGPGLTGNIIYGPVQLTEKHILKLNFSQGAITVKMNGDTYWDYNVICP